jgi:hypothetical protein
MPLFCTLVERFVQARLQNGKWNYSWQQMEEDLAADDRLLLWWTKHQARLAKEPPDPDENQREPVFGERQDQSEPDEPLPTRLDGRAGKRHTIGVSSCWKQY